jgi:hypothetical protein
MCIWDDVEVSSLSFVFFQYSKFAAMMRVLGVTTVGFTDTSQREPWGLASFGARCATVKIT